MQKPNTEIDITDTYGSRDTTHAQPPNWCDLLVYNQNADI